MNKIKPYLIVIVLIICFTACDKKYIISQYHSITQDGWSCYDTLDYQFTIEDTEFDYSVFLNVIHNNDYKYRNLYLFTHRYDPDSVLVCDTLQLLLSAPSGQLLGRGFSDSKEAKFLLTDHMRFTQTGNYSMQIIQGMRDECIFGIEKIGFVISK